MNGSRGVRVAALAICIGLVLAGQIVAAPRLHAREVPTVTFSYTDESGQTQQGLPPTVRPGTTTPFDITLETPNVSYEGLQLDLSFRDSTVLPVGDLELTYTNSSSSTGTSEVALTQSLPQLVTGSYGAPFDVTLYSGQPLVLHCQLSLSAAVRGPLVVFADLDGNGSTSPIGEGAADTSVPRPQPALVRDVVAISRRSNGSTYLASSDTTGGGHPLQVAWGGSSGVRFSGDWQGAGDSLPTVYDPTTASYTFSTEGQVRGPAPTLIINGSLTLRFGRPDDVPIAGDFYDAATGSYDTLAVYRPSNQTFYLEGGTAAGMHLGRSGDIPLAGNWTGTPGPDTFGLYRPSTSTFYLLSPEGSVTAVRYGRRGDQPVVGDWDGRGTTLIAVRRGATYFLATSNTHPVSSPAFTFGRPSDTVTTSVTSPTVPDLEAIAHEPSNDGDNGWFIVGEGATAPVLQPTN